MKLGSRFMIWRRQPVWSVASSAVFFALGCGSSTPSGDAAQTVGNIVITDQNNYSANSSLDIPRLKTKPQADLQICWTAMTKDFLCHDVSAANDIKSVNFLQIKNLDEAKIESELTAGQLDSSNVISRAFDTSSSSTCATLSQFSLGGTSANPSTDYTVSTSKTYMLLFAKSTKLGSGGASMIFLEPTDGSDVTTVNAQADSCSILNFSADLSASSINVPSGGPYVLDWSKLTVDGLGNDVLFTDIDKLQLGFYQDATVSTLQSKFLDLDTSATKFYELAISNGATHADLKSAVSSSDGNFSGFSSTNGVWAAALRCTTCQVPTPIAVVILNPS